jgi:hypothetical protein
MKRIPKKMEQEILDKSFDLSTRKRLFYLRSKYTEDKWLSNLFTLEHRYSTTLIIKSQRGALYI